MSITTHQVIQSEKLPGYNNRIVAISLDKSRGNMINIHWLWKDIKNGKKSYGKDIKKSYDWNSMNGKNGIKNLKKRQTTLKFMNA